MKKYVISGLVMLSVLALSGCGNSSVSTDSSSSAKNYSIAKSIWKSSDGGETWEAKDQSKDKLSVNDLDVLSMAVNPGDSQNILVGFKNGGYIKTEDGGGIWQKTNFISERVYGLAFDPGNPQTIYASGVWQERGKLFKSEDSGENWKEIFTAASNGPFIVALIIDKNNPKIIYATTSDKQAMKSEDSGESWKNIYQAKSPIVKLAMDSSHSNLIYAITLNGQVSRSTDSGKTFSDITGNLLKKLSFSVDDDYEFLEADPQNSNWVYLAGKSGIIRSKDAGDSWEKVVTLNDPSSSPVTALAINPQNSNELIYGAAQAIYKSTDGGSTWKTSQFDTEKSISVIKYDPKNPQNIYLGLKKQ